MCLFSIQLLSDDVAVLRKHVTVFILHILHHEVHNNSVSFQFQRELLA